MREAGRQRYRPLVAAEDVVRKWSAAIREIEVLEPWLTESAWDEDYWDDVAKFVVAQVGERPSRTAARDGLAAALRAAFPGVVLEADNGLYREGLDYRLNLIVGLALDAPSP